MYFSIFKVTAGIGAIQDDHLGIQGLIRHGFRFVCTRRVKIMPERRKSP